MITTQAQQSRRKMTFEPELGLGDQFHERLKSLIGDQKPFEWAKKVGIPSSTFERIWNRRAVPKAGHLLVISDFCGVSVDWLLRGQDPVNLRKDTHHSPILTIPFLDTPTLDSSGRLIMEKSLEISQVCLRAEQSEIDDGAFLAAKMRGNTMEPTLGDGDIVVVDTRKKSISGSIMALGWNGEFHIRRLDSQLGGPVIISDNKQFYSSQSLTQDDLSKIFVLGEVVWFCRKLK